MTLCLTIEVSKRLNQEDLRLVFAGRQYVFNRVLGCGASGVVLSFVPRGAAGAVSLRDRVAVKIHARIPSKRYALKDVACINPSGLRVKCIACSQVLSLSNSICRDHAFL